MPIKLNAGDNGFAQQFVQFLNLREQEEQSVAGIVTAIIGAIRARGDVALADYTQQFDRHENSLIIGTDAMESAKAELPKDVLSALHTAADRIRSYHEKQLPKNEDFTDTQGVRLGWRWTAVDAVGMYVPGGLASYPSSVLMNAIPAKVSGVKRLVMTVPTPGGEINQAVLAAASIAGVDEVYAVGGAQAVAALAYGTHTIAPVDKIVGPGNAFVAEAKRQVFGKVGIDLIAGPSEILVIADKHNNPQWIAADLLSQAEHDETAQSILITDDAAFADAVEREVQNILNTLPRANIANASWNRFGAIIVVSSLAQAAELANRIAAEHLELAVADPDALMGAITHAGAFFLGSHTPEAIGDYIAGPSHVLPTSRTARFSSGLSVLDFMKRSSIIGCSAPAFETIGRHAETLANAEGLQAHALSLSLRLKP